MRRRLLSVYRALLRAQGHQDWWPGETPFEVVVGAVLTQGTAWRNVEKALGKLRQAGVLEPAALLATSRARLRTLLVPAGYFRVKEARLRAVVAWWARQDLGRLRSADPPALRAELLAVHGVGPETADSILLYAIGLPSFVVDAYTRRIFGRLGLVPPQWSYEDTRTFFERALPADASLWNDYHAQIVRLGNTRCRPTPICTGCPLYRTCLFPISGTVAADGPSGKDLRRRLRLAKGRGRGALRGRAVG